VVFCHTVERAGDGAAPEEGAQVRVDDVDGCIANLNVGRPKADA